MPAHPAATSDPQHDLLHELSCLQPSAAHMKKKLRGLQVYVCCMCVKEKNNTERKTRKEAVRGVMNPLRPH